MNISDVIIVALSIWKFKCSIEYFIGIEYGADIAWPLANDRKYNNWSNTKRNKNNHSKKRNFRWRTNTLKQSHNPKTRKNVVLTVNVIERLFGLPFIVLCCSRCSSVLFIYSFFLSLSLCLFLSVYTIFDSFVWCIRKCLQMMQTSYWLGISISLFVFNNFLLAFELDFSCNFIHWCVYCLFMYIFLYFLCGFTSG